MGLVSSNITEKWYRPGNWVYQNFVYLFQNPLWHKRLPKGFSECPLFWMALFSFLVVRIAVPFLLPLKWVFEKAKKYSELLATTIILGCFAVLLGIVGYFGYQFMSIAYEGLSSELQVVAFWGMLGLILGFVSIQVSSEFSKGCKVRNYQYLLLPAFAAACLFFAPKESIACVMGWWKGLLGLLSVCGAEIMNWVLVPTGSFLASLGRFLFLESFWGIPVIVIWIASAVAAYFLTGFIGERHAEATAKRLPTEDEWYDRILSVYEFAEYRSRRVMAAYHRMDSKTLKRLSAAYVRLLLRRRLAIPQEFLTIPYPSFVKAFELIENEIADSLAAAFTKAGVSVELSDKIDKTVNSGVSRLYDSLDEVEGVKDFIEECPEFRQIWESYFKPQKTEPEPEVKELSWNSRWCRKSTELVGKVFGFIGTCFKVIGYGFVAIWVTLKSWKQGVCAYRKFEHES